MTSEPIVFVYNKRLLKGRRDASAQPRRPAAPRCGPIPDAGAARWRFTTLSAAAWGSLLPVEQHPDLIRTPGPL
ncbi:hypothetical protein ACRAWD_30880 [Caulobacter segnis]